MLHCDGLKPKSVSVFIVNEDLDDKRGRERLRLIEAGPSSDAWCTDRSSHFTTRRAFSHALSCVRQRAVFTYATHIQN